MKRFGFARLALFSLVVAVLLAAVSPVCALAETRYKVRVFAGNNGSVNGVNVYTVPGDYAYGDEVRLEKSWVSVEDGSKYYVKGFRLSGADDLHSEVFTITEDTDFVVAYGVPGEMVSYTISFVEYGTGLSLQNDRNQTSVTFYGKKGDKPVVPYEYVPGYRPRYRNITGTLGDEGTNNWTLEYIPLEAAQTVVIDGGTTTTTTTTTGGAAGGTAGTEGAAGTEGGAAGGEQATTPEGGAAGTGGTETQTTVPQTEEILDVDTPLAGPGNTQGQTGTQTGTTNGSKSSLGALAGAGILAAIVGIIVAVAAFLAFRNREDDDPDSDE